jgi:integrase/recombinase XerD
MHKERFACAVLNQLDKPHPIFPLRYECNESSHQSALVLILPEFQEALDAMPRADDALRFLVTGYGRAFKSPAAFGNKFADWCRAAGLEPVLCTDGVTRNYRAHGLRKTSLRALAHAGCSGSEMMEVSGHSSLAQLQEYLDEVEQERQADAAMAKLMASRAKKATSTYKLSDPDLQTGS